MLPTLSVTFDLQIRWDFVSRYETGDGFKLYIIDPVTIFSSPIAVPGGMHATIQIYQPTEVKDLNDCHLVPPSPYWDDKAFICKQYYFMYYIFLTNVAGCDFQWGTYYANSSTACTGTQMLPLKMLLSHGLDYDTNSEFDMALEQKVVSSILNVFYSLC